MSHGPSLLEQSCANSGDHSTHAMDCASALLRSLFLADFSGPLFAISPWTGLIHCTEQKDTQWLWIA